MGEFFLEQPNVFGEALSDDRFAVLFHHLLQFVTFGFLHRERDVHFMDFVLVGQIGNVECAFEFSSIFTRAD